MSDTSISLGQQAYVFIEVRRVMGTNNRRLGGRPLPGNRFVSFVRAYARSGSEVGIVKKWGLALSLFPFSEFCVVLVSPSEI